MPPLYSTWALKFFRALSCQRWLAKYLCGESQNALEEALLLEAYGRKDRAFAHFLIENGFYGNMQPQLFQIIFICDPDKAREVAGRLTPNCVSWMLLESTGRSTAKPPEPLRLIFDVLTPEKADAVRHCLKRGDAQARALYDALMNARA